MSITGRNGSGKSTLIKILASILSQTSGDFSILVNDKKIEKREYYKYIGFVSPYLNLYDEFTGFENLNFVTKVRKINPDRIETVLKTVGLWERRHDDVKVYSSGMKQRLKIAFSIIHQPPILLFDEPTSNLDTEGIKIIENISAGQKKEGVLIIATNDEHEKSLCEKELNIVASGGGKK